MNLTRDKTVISLRGKIPTATWDKLVAQRESETGKVRRIIRRPKK